MLSSLQSDGASKPTRNRATQRLVTGRSSLLIKIFFIIKERSETLMRFRFVLN